MSLLLLFLAFRVESSINLTSIILCLPGFSCSGGYRWWSYILQWISIVTLSNTLKFHYPHFKPAQTDVNKFCLILTFDKWLNQTIDKRMCKYSRDFCKPKPLQLWISAVLFLLNDRKKEEEDCRDSTVQFFCWSHLMLT